MLFTEEKQELHQRRAALVAFVSAAVVVSVCTFALTHKHFDIGLIPNVIEYGDQTEESALGGWSVTLSTVDPTRSDLLLINSEGGRNTHPPLRLINAVRQTGVSASEIETTQSMGDNLCMCATSEDTWKGRLVSIHTNDLVLSGPATELALSTASSKSDYHKCWLFEVDTTGKKLKDLGHSDECSFVKEYSLTLDTSDPSSDALTFTNLRPFVFEEETRLTPPLNTAGVMNIKAELLRGIGSRVCLCNEGDSVWTGKLTGLEAPLFDDARSDRVRVTMDESMKKRIEISTGDPNTYKCWLFDVDVSGKPGRMTLSDAGGADSCSVSVSTSESLADMSEMCDTLSKDLMHLQSSVIDIQSETQSLSMDISTENANWQGTLNDVKRRPQLQSHRQVLTSKVAGSVEKYTVSGVSTSTATISDFASALSLAESVPARMMDSMARVAGSKANNDLFVNHLTKLAESIGSAQTDIDHIRIDASSSPVSGMTEDMSGVFVIDGVQSHVQGMKKWEDAIRAVSTSVDALKQATEHSEQRSQQMIFKLESDTQQFVSAVKKFVEQMMSLSKGMTKLPVMVMDLAQTVGVITQAVLDLFDSMNGFRLFGDLLFDKVHRLFEMTDQLSVYVREQSGKLAQTQRGSMHALRQSGQTAAQLKAFSETTADSLADLSRRVEVYSEECRDQSEMMRSMEHRIGVESGATHLRELINDQSMELQRMREREHSMQMMIASLSARLSALESEQHANDDEDNLGDMLMNIANIAHHI